MGPLKGYRIIELAGLGPAPFCGMMLADMGAELIQIVRSSSAQQAHSANSKRPINVDMRGRRSLALDLKNPKAIEVVLKLCESADGFIEGFRPGVVERLGIGPHECRQRNPKLVYARMTGWGQNGPLAQRAGHDINYVAIGGALYNIGRKGEKPVLPMNYVGDYGGGAMMLAFGLLCGILEAQKSGCGQVVDAAMVDGVAALQAFNYEFYHYNLYKERGTHFLGGAHHSYDTYETKDGQFMAVGAVEVKFHDELVEKLGLDKVRFANKSIFEAFLDEKAMQPLKEEVTRAFKTRTRDEWCKIFDGSDACVMPVLTIDEAAQHPHNVARNTFIKRDGVLQHAPVPRFDRTVAEAGSLPRFPGEDSQAILKELGYSEQEIKELSP